MTNIIQIKHVNETFDRILDSSNSLIQKSFDCSIPFGIETYKNKQIVNLELTDDKYIILELEKQLRDAYFNDDNDNISNNICQWKSAFRGNMLRTKIFKSMIDIFSEENKRLSSYEFPKKKKCHVKIRLRGIYRSLWNENTNNRIIIETNTQNINNNNYDENKVVIQPIWEILKIQILSNNK